MPHALTRQALFCGDAAVQAVEVDDPDRHHSIMRIRVSGFRFQQVRRSERASASEG
jgi:hypothetical protein